MPLGRRWWGAHGMARLPRSRSMVVDLPAVSSRVATAKRLSAYCTLPNPDMTTVRAILTRIQHGFHRS